MARQRALVRRWLAAGVVFGWVFPTVGLFVAGGGLTPRLIALAHASQPVLWIVDLAPLVLGGAGLIIGRAHARLDAAHRRTADLVRVRTAALRATTAELEQLVRAKDQFVAAVSHELRTPISAIVGFSQELANNVDALGDDEIRELSQLLVEQGGDVAGIVEDLLVAARADIAKVPIRPEPVDLLKIAEGVLAGHVVGASDVVDVTYDGSAPMAFGDPVRVRQIIRNLGSNAVRYGGDRIRVEVSGGSGTVSLQVADNGPGLPEEDWEAIFVSYVQSSAARSVAGSIGLGLTVSRTLARLMEGDLAYRYEDGESIFELTLPQAVDVGRRGSVTAAPAPADAQS